MWQTCKIDITTRASAVGSQGRDKGHVQVVTDETKICRIWHIDLYCGVDRAFWRQAQNPPGIGRSDPVASVGIDGRSIRATTKSSGVGK